MSSWFVVTWLAWTNCSGGFLARFAPEFSKPVLCEPSRKWEAHRTRAQAEARLHDLDRFSFPTVAWCQRRVSQDHCWPRSVRRTVVITLE